MTTTPQPIATQPPPTGDATPPVGPQQPPNLDALAAQFGGTVSDAASAAPSGVGGGQDLDALAQKFGGTVTDAQQPTAGPTAPQQGLVSRLWDWLKEADKSGVSTAEDFSKGVAKEGAKTLVGAGHLVVPDWALKASGANTQEEIDKRNADVDKATATEGTAQKLGAATEQFGEWASGEEVMKGLSELTKLNQLPALMKNLGIPGRKLVASLGRIGKSAATGAAIEGNQANATGGDAGEAAKSGAELGAVGGAVGEAVTGLGGMVRRAFDSNKAVMNDETVQGVKDIANQIVNKIPVEQNETNFGQSLVDAVRQTKSDLQDQFEAIGKQMIENPAAVDVQSSMPGVKVTKVKAPMVAAVRNAKVSQAVLPMSEVASLGKDAEDMIASDFRVPPGREDVAGLNPTEQKAADLMRDTADATKPLSIEDAIALRKRMLNLAESDELSTVQKGALKKYAGLVNDKTIDTLDRVAPQYAKRYRDLNEAYATFNKTIDEGVLSNLFDLKGGKVSLKKDPTKVGAYLWNQASDTSATELKTLVGDKGMDLGRKSILNYMWNEALSKSLDGEDAAKTFVKLWRKGGPEGQAAYFDKPMREQIDALTKTLERNPSALGTLLKIGHPYVHAHVGGVVISPYALAEFMTPSPRNVKSLRDALGGSRFPQAVERLRQAALAGATAENGSETDESGSLDPTPLTDDMPTFGPGPTAQN